MAAAVGSNAYSFTMVITNNQKKSQREFVANEQTTVDEVFQAIYGKKEGCYLQYIRYNDWNYAKGDKIPPQILAGSPGHHTNVWIETNDIWDKVDGSERAGKTNCGLDMVRVKYAKTEVILPQQDTIVHIFKELGLGIKNGSKVPFTTHIEFADKEAAASASSKETAATASGSSAVAK